MSALQGSSLVLVLLIPQVNFLHSYQWFTNSNNINLIDIGWECQKVWENATEISHCLDPVLDGDARWHHLANTTEQCALQQQCWLLLSLL